MRLFKSYLVSYNLTLYIMSPNILFKSLLDLGVMEFDAKTYLYYLDNPKSSVTQVAQVLATNRVRVYESLKRLEEKDLIERSLNNILTPVSPNKILSQLRFKETKTHRLSADLEEAIPDLLYKYNSQARNPNVKVYEGRNNFIRLAIETIDELKEGQEILWFAEGEELYDIVGSDFFNTELGKRRSQKNVKARILANAKNPLASDPKVNREVRYLPSDFKTLGTVSIAGASIVNWNTVLPKAVLIQDGVMAKMYTSMFNFIWDQSPTQDV